MDFQLTDEQRTIVATVRKFVEKELYASEDEGERLDDVPPEVVAAVRSKALDAGIYAANMPAEMGVWRPGCGGPDPRRARAGPYVLRAADAGRAAEQHTPGMHR